ncbi:MAG: tRNA glutamyl-Q(34) synthetase GluQRS [Phycisphaeraceae bacterium]
MPEQPTKPGQLSPAVTRLAPSPTGALHLGNARTFLINWALAKQHGWRIVLRIEDLDGPRVKPGADTQAIGLLAWLGMDWDEGPYYQASELSPYHEALCRLLRHGLIYPCTCSRKDIEQAQSAPHQDSHELRYPGTCRPGPEADRAYDCGSLLEASHQAWRIIVPEDAIAFDDRLHGRQSVNIHEQVGDFIVATKSGLPAYQLAVVVDDARQGVTDVVRGDDLLGSTARQLWLYRVLELEPVPRYTHLPLVLGPDGRRLAKRHGDTRLDRYRQMGVSSERVIGLIAWWSGVCDERTEMSAQVFAERFSLERLPRNPVTYTQEDEAWLLAGCCVSRD